MRCASGHMLETPRIPRYSPTNGSENASGADNQQERLELELENPQRPYARHPITSDDEMVPSAWRHAGTSSKEVTSVRLRHVRIRHERNSLSGNWIARAGSNIQRTT